MLSADDKAALAVFVEEHADWCDYDYKSEEGCTPAFGCGAWKRKAAHEATVEQIVARHVAAALTEAADAVEAVDPFEWALGGQHAGTDAARIVRSLANP